MKRVATSLVLIPLAVWTVLAGPQWLFLLVVLAVGLALYSEFDAIAGSQGIPRAGLVLVVLSVAVVKASLVAMFFMHLKVDWTKVKVMIIPALVLAAVLVLALLPDITLAMRDRPGKKPPSPAAAPAHSGTAGHAP